MARFSARSARSTSISSDSSAASANTVTRLLATSTKPPLMAMRAFSWPTSPYWSTPACKPATRGAWSTMRPKYPSVPGKMMDRARSCNTVRAGVTTSSSSILATLSALPQQGAALLHGLVDVAHHVEGGFGQVVVAAFENLLEAADRLRQGHVAARRAGKAFGHEEGLGQEPLDFPSPGHDELVFFRQLVHTQDGDDVLKLCVALQHLLHAPGYLVVLFSDDTRFQNTGGGAEGVHRRVNTLLRDAPLQVRRSEERRVG